MTDELSLMHCSTRDRERRGEKEKFYDTQIDVVLQCGFFDLWFASSLVSACRLLRPAEFQVIVLYSHI